MKSISAIILFFAAIGLVFMIARPMWDEISVLRAESKIIADNLAQLKEVEATRDQLLNTYNSISKDDLARLEEFLPAKANTEDLLVSMESFAKARGIQLKNINFSIIPNTQLIVVPDTAPDGTPVPPAPPLPSTVSYNLTVSASYEAFRSLIDAFEKNLRLTDLSEIAFTSADTGIYSFTLKTKSYYQK
ncbi:MAG: hypothetical protein Q7S12_04450 [bacterium]|nr:hypothetical protein [bacterium]